MKKLYHKATVHPSPPVISDQLSFLPATILTLAAALSPEDREVLAYLIFCSSAATPPAFANFSGNSRRGANKSAVAKGSVDGDHSPLFNCSCFNCYTSYWVRWDESPNRQLIHEIIDAFEDWLAQSNKGGKKGNGKKEKRNKKGSNKNSGELKRAELMSSASSESESVGESSTSDGGGGGEGGGDGVVAEEKGSVRRFMSFVGERIWGGWGQ
ncbi:uncharacterized protein LOC133287260 [Gastrolobium bilobum]|uniref:uncharacterized protein LOC133287260 n=1 Tax=Gastrolobium bilobum TaxID=150636 RepID=UPI002AB1C768|nr:uncharacterized protein LOC133287260 [Gastrolobium bilobum]